jgi:photosystem II stability/assembly factor-like uncharacterized protein
MKNILLFPIIFPFIFAFIFSACSDFSGNEDAVEASLEPGPVTQQQQEEEEEEEESVSTRTYHHLYGVAFGNNTFVAVGAKGTVRTSSDNGSSWDNGTSGNSEKYFDEVAYEDSRFIAVGQSGRIYTSSDNGTTWSRSTWNGSTASLTGVASGNNVSIAVSSSAVIKSTDNASNWTLKNSAVEVYDMAYGHRTASGKVATCGTITHGGDHDDGTYNSVALSGGSGSGAEATVVVSGDNVTSVSITDGGTSFYQIGDVLTIDNATIGGNDNGEVATCDNITHGGEVATVDNITHNGDHDNGTHSVALSGGSGSGAVADVTVSADNVTSVSITDGGTGLYQIGDVLTIDNATIGGADNATIRVATVSGDHVNGTYNSVALSGGSGSGAEATVIVSGDNVTSVSITDGGTGLYQIGDVLTIDNAKTGGDDNATCRVATVTAINATCRVATVTVTSTVFIGVGAKGGICYSEFASPHNHGEEWSCVSPIVPDKKLYGIAYGNNKFIAVGQSGTVIISDNGSGWATITSNTSANLNSIAFGNDKFVGVGSNTVIVSTDNGTSFLETNTEHYLRDVTYGNGVFVAVGYNENIYTSTDGDTWTKVYGKP